MLGFDIERWRRLLHRWIAISELISHLAINTLLPVAILLATALLARMLLGCCSR